MDTGTNCLDCVREKMNYFISGYETTDLFSSNLNDFHFSIEPNYSNGFANLAISDDHSHIVN